MEDKVKAFLASGRLEEYIYGTLGDNDQQEVEKYIKKYPEVNKEYQLLQQQLEKVSRQMSIKAPSGMKSQIMDSLPDKQLPTSTTKISWAKYAAIFGLVTSLLLAWGWKTSNDQLNAEKGNYATLAADCDEREKQIEDQRKRIAFLNSEQTQRYEMSGNDLAPDFKAIVFVNEAFGKAIITPSNKVNLPSNKCVQLWGDLDGEMIPIAVLDDLGSKEYDLTINPQFTSLNMTIEEKTNDGKGKLHPDVSQLISSVLI